VAHVPQRTFNSPGDDDCDLPTGLPVEADATGHWRHHVPMLLPRQIGAAAANESGIAIESIATDAKEALSVRLRRRRH